MITVTKTNLPPIKEYISYMKRIWKNNWITNDGQFLQLLESKLKKYLGSEKLALVSNGTSSLHIAIKLLNLKGEVITTPFTFAASTNVILWEGLNPVFADINLDTFNIDPEDVVKKITSKTSAILAVHVYGNPCYVRELEKIARKYNLSLIFDASHAFGVSYNNRPIVDYGDISTLSFHATKIFHTIEGGAIIVNNKKLLTKAKLLRNHGIQGEDKVLLPGTNAKMNEFQAIMGLCNMKTVNRNIMLRKKLYNYYKKSLSNFPIQFQEILASKYNYSYMPVCFENQSKRNQAHKNLLEHGIAPRKYFHPLTTDFDYFLKKKSNLNKKYGLKNSMDISSRILCLPLYPELDFNTVDKIVKIIINTLR